MNLKETLQHYRKRQGLSQIELAEALDVSRQTISKWETGTALPSAENLLALSKLYGVPVDALLNGVDMGPDALPPEDSPEFLPIPDNFSVSPSSAPEHSLLPRRKLVLRMLAVIFLCDLLLFFMDISWYSVAMESGFATIVQLLRLLVCCAVGLCFAWFDQRWPAKKKTSILITIAALVCGLYPILFATPLLWRLYDLIVWTGYRTFEANFPPDPVRHFIGFTLCDEVVIFCHMCVVIVFQLGRLCFSRKTSRSFKPQPVH